MSQEVQKYREKDLAKADKGGLVILEKMKLILNFMYVGETYQFRDRYYRMDGNFNPYIVSLNVDGTPKARGEEDFPIFQNEVFWNILSTMAEEMSEETYNLLKVNHAVIVTLNDIK